jgi:hypothetical protein
MKGFAASMTRAKDRALTPVVHSVAPELLQLLLSGRASSWFNGANPEFLLKEKARVCDNVFR